MRLAPMPSHGRLQIQTPCLNDTVTGQTGIHQMPSQPSGTLRQNGIPWHNDKQCWQCWTRDQLPAAYTAIENWWSPEGLAYEESLTQLFRIPNAPRGPPGGPREGHPTRRNLEWRPVARKWMNRGGKRKAQHDAMYSKSNHR